MKTYCSGKEKEVNLWKKPLHEIIFGDELKMVKKRYLILCWIMFEAEFFYRYINDK